MATHTLTIPDYHPPAANAWVGRHWSAKHRLCREAAELFAAHAAEQGVPAATGKRRVRLELTGWAHGGPFADADAYDKLTLDALTRAGLIVDDGGRGLAGRVEVAFARGERRTVIVMEDVL